MTVGSTEANDVELHLGSFHRNSILESVAKSKGFFKSQQRGEKDLTFEEKKQIASDLLDGNCKLFLQRYWKFMDPKDIPFFNDVSDDYEVKFYLDSIQKYNNDKSRKVLCRNRRYQALKKLVKEGKYFSHDEMKERNPLLYEQLVGKYLTQEQREAQGKQNQYHSFSGFLIECMNRQCTERFKKQQEEEENAAMEEEDSTDEEDEEKDGSMYQTVQVQISANEQNMLMEEFTHMMYESFLSGNDKDFFDYSLVDDNEEYDPVKEREEDEQEKYFDED